MPVRSTNGSLPSQGFWGKLKGKSNKEAEFRERQAQMALSRQRLLTLAYGDMETIRMVHTNCFDSIVLSIRLTSFALAS